MYFFFRSCVSALNIAAVIVGCCCCCCPAAVESDSGRDVTLGLGDGEPDCPFITGLEYAEVASPSREDTVERRTRFDSGL